MIDINIYYILQNVTKDEIEGEKLGRSYEYYNSVINTLLQEPLL